MFENNNKIPIWSSGFPSKNPLLRNDNFSSQQNGIVDSFGTCPVAPAAIQITNCTRPPVIENSYDYNRNREGYFNEVRHFKCIGDYSPQPNSGSITCKRDGCWTEASCQPPTPFTPAIANVSNFYLFISQFYYFSGVYRSR